MTKNIDDVGLVGQFFHTFGQDKKIEWQGYVIGRPEPGIYLVQLFSWLDGGETSRRLVPITKMSDWLFYPDCQAMKFSMDHGEAYTLDARCHG